MAGFRLVLALHAPVILPDVVPRLDTLLMEGARRLMQNWEDDHPLPLVFDDHVQGYRASQLIFGTTTQKPMVASSPGLSTKMLQSDLTLVNKLPKRLRQDGGPDAQRLTRHQAISAPYAVFYGDGDAHACTQLLSAISAVGREHKRHYGAFTIHSIEASESDRWALRPWPAENKSSASQYLETEWMVDQIATSVRGAQRPVIRPARVLREKLNA